jgi:hypothetical protein
MDVHLGLTPEKQKSFSPTAINNVKQTANDKPLVTSRKAATPRQRSMSMNTLYKQRDSKELEKSKSTRQLITKDDTATFKGDTEVQIICDTF